MIKKFQYQGVQKFYLYILKEKKKKKRVTWTFIYVLQICNSLMENKEVNMKIYVGWAESVEQLLKAMRKYLTLSFSLSPSWTLEVSVYAEHQPHFILSQFKAR